MHNAQPATEPTMIPIRVPVDMPSSDAFCSAKRNYFCSTKKQIDTQDCRLPTTEVGVPEGPPVVASGIVTLSSSVLHSLNFGFLLFVDNKILLMKKQKYFTFCKIVVVTLHNHTSKF
jgi:hypothetical protein